MYEHMGFVRAPELDWQPVRAKSVLRGAKIIFAYPGLDLTISVGFIIAPMTINSLERIMITQDDKQFLARFEALTLEPRSFDHKAHLRLAYLCIMQDGLEPAIERVGRGIRAFAEHLGANDKYHQTITEALVRVIGLRLARQPAPDWQRFFELNPDLVNQAKEVLLQHYSPERLFSVEARSRFIEPDRLPLEAAGCTPLVK
jgi:hypothetical protein